MGQKISWEDAEKLGLGQESNDSIFAPPNKYGYKIRINHPSIKPLYERYKDKVGERILSDKQRFEFEMHIINALKKHHKNNLI